MKNIMTIKNGFYLTIALLTFCGLSLSTNLAAQTLITNDLNGPAGSVKFGTHVAVLPNGNFVVTDPEYSISGGAQLVGAVYLYSRDGNLISTLTGSTENDQVGSDGITVLANGNYVIQSRRWNNGSALFAAAVTFGRMTTGVSGVVSSSNSLVGSTENDSSGQFITPLPNGNYVVRAQNWDNGNIINAGAVTLGSGTIGISGTISPSNSRVGSTANDRIGKLITLLSNGNYVIGSPDWNDGRGAATFGDRDTRLSGVVSSANSLVGSTGGGLSLGDRVGDDIVPLSNGNYVVHGTKWDNGAATDAGFAAFGNGTTGVSGEILSSNSIVGTSTDHNIGEKVTPLTNGNYVVQSPNWDNGSTLNVGAVRFCRLSNGCTGFISSSNSLIGSKANDNVGSTVTRLTNGNYVVQSPLWDDGNTLNVGAVTFVSGTAGISGTVSTANSLVGSTAEDMVGGGDTGALTNGNYVVVSPEWDNSNIINAGAATLGNGTTGITGFISASNSLVGSTAEDNVGSRRVTPLTNGNYIVATPDWDDGAITNVGALTFGNGTNGVTGTISASNSLIGSHASDQVGYGSFFNRALANGNYLVLSNFWNNSAGAVTLGNGTTGVFGTVSSANSLIGSTANDRVGSGATILSNGKYILPISAWDNGGITNAGAVTFGEDATVITGAVSPSNSLVGNQTDDFINQFITELANGYFIIQSPRFDNGNIVDAGAFTFSNTPLIGQINSNNSILGTVAGEFPILTSYSFDESINRLYVGRPLLNKVTRASLSTDQTPRTKFDFDGDGKSDLSIFRPAPAEWWLLRSSDGGNNAFQFGQTSDKIVPADFTGDGKTDIAFWREATGEWFILRSEDSSFYSFPFGATGDIPVPADYDGDGIADAAVFRPSNATWYISNSSGGTTISGFGVSTDKPIPADYDGDGKADLAIWRPNGTNGAEFWLNRSTAGVFVVGFGNSTDKPVVGDYTGDGKDDVAFWRPSTGEWFILRSEDASFYSFPFGANGDIPAPGDYDGDGTFDATVFRPNSTTWFINGSTSGTIIQNFGISTDRPLANSYVP